MAMPRITRILILIVTLSGSIASGCSERVEPPAQPLGLAGGLSQIRVIDETTGRPFERFTIAMTRADDRPFPDRFSFPPGFGPMPPGDLLEIGWSTICRSTA